MGDPFQSIKSIYALLQDYWLLTIVVLGWFLKNTVKGWVDSRLSIEVAKATEAEKANAARELEELKRQFSGELEEAKLRIEIRKAIALDLAKQRFEAYKELEVKFGAVGVAVRNFLSHAEPARSEIVTANGVFSILTEASDLLAQRQILLPYSFASELREFVAFCGSMVIQYGERGTAASDLLLNSVDVSIKDIKRQMRDLLQATATDSFK